MKGTEKQITYATKIQSAQLNEIECRVEDIKRNWQWFNEPESAIPERHIARYNKLKAELAVLATCKFIIERADDANFILDYATTAPVYCPADSERTPYVDLRMVNAALECGFITETDLSGVTAYTRIGRIKKTF